MSITFGRVTHPPFIDRLIPDRQNVAWDDLGPRKPVGVCQHSMLGTLWGTDEYFRRGKDGRSLTDYGIGGATDGDQWDGVILRWNDPLGRATSVNLDGQSWPVSANRAPWANGGSDGLEGDGPVFVRTLGINAINRDLVSIERSDGGKADTPISAKQLASICQLTAYWFDQAKVKWSDYPLNGNTGCITHMLHYEFATKGCPYPPVISRISEIQAKVRQILKTAQTGDATTEEPASPPTTPDREWWPQGYDLIGLRQRFGELTRLLPSGEKIVYVFDPSGAISNAWVARGVQAQLALSQLPRPLHWWTLGADDSAVDIITFETAWTLYRAASGNPWIWID